MTYSIDFRRQVLLIREREGLSFAEASVRFHIGKASIVRWSNCLEPKLTRHKPATKITDEALRQDVVLYPDAYN